MTRPAGFTVLLLGLLCSAEQTRADSYSFDIIQYGLFDTGANGINNLGQIVGGTYFGTESPGTGFVYTNGAFTQLDSQLTSINDKGQILGFDNGAFLYSNGVFSTIDVPGTVPGNTFARGINYQGQIVGGFNVGTPFITGHLGFLDNNGVFTTIDVPGSLGTSANGINNAGQIVGAFTDTSGGTHGFLDSGGVFTAIDVPASRSTSAQGINNAGQIVGRFIDASGQTHGFLDDNGVFTIIDVPLAGVSGSYASGINDAGQIVGGVWSYNKFFVATPASEPVPEPMPSTLLGLSLTIISFLKRPRRIFSQ